MMTLARLGWRLRCAYRGAPADTAALIDQLRADGTVLAYDPVGRTLRADDAPSVTIGRGTTSTHSRRNQQRSTT